MEYEYDVALSFAGEEREYVDKVAEYLREKGINVFYDGYEEATLWGKDLYVHLDEIYRKQARYCVMFLSKNYASKVWTNHERKSAQARAFQEKKEYILPARFDDTEIPGIGSTTGYIDLQRRTPEELGALIIKKIGKKDIKAEEKDYKEFRRPRVVKQSFNPYDEAQKFIDFVVTGLRGRCIVLSNQGVSLSVFNRDGRTCLRVVCNGETKYSLDTWIGGISGDSGISFYGVEGTMSSFSSSSSNAWGEIEWSKERERIVLKFHDLSFLDILSTEEKEYAKEEFLENLWDKICNVIEAGN